MRPRTATRWWRIPASVLLPLFITASLLTDCTRRQPALHIENPYASVDWRKDGQYKANLHTHTTLSGGNATPQDVIDQYRELGYGILALTDHDDDSLAEPTWPWQAFDREPEALDMVAIQGNEISEVHHIGSHFNDYGDPEVQSEEEALEEIGRRGGVAVFHHPGRYEKGVEWYVDMYRRYDHLIGQEVYNRNDRYPGDRKAWDALLTELLPERPVWGLASDDMHNLEKDIGISWNVIIVPELTKDLVRQALEQGRFFFVNSPKGKDGSAAPVIEAITVDEPSGTIHLKASGHEFIEWVSKDTIIHRGDQLKLADLPDTLKYVRAEVYSADGTVVGTQPFQILRPEHRE